MTYREINNLIKTLAGLLEVPSSYYQFEEETSPPFLTFNYPDSDDFYADDVNYQRKTRLDIYYCSDFRDLSGAEQQIETFLKLNEMPYTKEATYIESEKMWETIYSTEVLLDEQS